MAEENPKNSWRTYAGKAKWAIYLLVAALLAIGFDFKTPKRQFDELRAQDTKMAADHVVLKEHVLGQDLILRAMAIKTCLSTPADELSLMQLPCDSLLKNARSRQNGNRH